ncbi:MAG: type II toxin-antitoxin system mRNA interferase toxin, RelE/StbE family [bacterium]
MEIYYSGRFAKSYKKLPEKTRESARKREKIFRKDPFDSRLKTHKLKGNLSGFWAFSIDDSYRIIFEFRDKNTVWFLLAGNHSIYEKWD